jgi:serine protease Do
MDLAVIAVALSDLESDTKNAIAIATLGDSDTLRLGEPAIAIGNALGYGQSVTTGVISAVNRVIELDDNSEDKGTFIQTNAEINPGNSGGALLNINGEVIGINSNKIGGEAVEGMGYAIPISTAKPIIEQLMTEKTRAKVSEEKRGYIGISGVSVTSEVSQMYGLPAGVYVAGVADNGGAKAAGLQEGDIITKFDGKEIASMDDLQNRLAYYEAGETVNVTVMRQATGGYAEQEFTVTLSDSSSVNSESNQQEQEKYQDKDNSDQENNDQEEEGKNYYPEEDEQFDPFGFGGSNGFGFGFDFGN